MRTDTTLWSEIYDLWNNKVSYVLIYGTNFTLKLI
jgi:hypothetical protein